MLRYLILLWLAIGLSTTSFAQDRPIDVGVFLGMTNYQGDFVEENWPLFKEGNAGLGVLLRQSLNDQFNYRVNLFYGKISGDDFNYEARRGRGLSFSTPIFEIAVAAEWEPLGARRSRNTATFRKILSPYLMTGIGLAFTNPKVDYSRREGDITIPMLADQNNKSSSTRFAIPMGVGVKYDVSEQWIIALEFGMRYAFTDYLDGLSQAGNPDKNDWYQFSGLTLTRRL